MKSFLDNDERANRMRFAHLLRGLASKWGIKADGVAEELGAVSGLGPDAIRGYLRGERKLNEDEILRLFASKLLGEPYVRFANRLLQASGRLPLPEGFNRPTRPRCGWLTTGRLRLLDRPYRDFSEFLRILPTTGMSRYRLQQLVDMDPSIMSRFRCGERHPTAAWVLRIVLALSLPRDGIQALNEWLIEAGLETLPMPGIDIPGDDSYRPTG